MNLGVVIGSVEAGGLRSAKLNGGTILKSGVLDGMTFCTTIGTIIINKQTKRKLGTIQDGVRRRKRKRTKGGVVAIGILLTMMTKWICIDLLHRLPIKLHRNDKSGFLKRNEQNSLLSGKPRHLRKQKLLERTTKLIDGTENLANVWRARSLRFANTG